MDKSKLLDREEVWPAFDVPMEPKYERVCILSVGFPDCEDPNANHSVGMQVPDGLVLHNFVTYEDSCVDEFQWEVLPSVDYNDLALFMQRCANAGCLVELATRYLEV